MESIIALLAVVYVLGFGVGYSLASRWNKPEAKDDMPMPLLGVVQPKEKRDTDA